MKKNQEKMTRTARLSMFFYERVFLSATLWASIFIFGLLSYTVFLQRQGFPSVDVPVSIAQGVYFVGDKNTVDEQLAKPIGEAAKSLDEVKSVNTSSFDNQATIVVEYQEGITSEEGSKLLQEKVEQTVDIPESAQLAFQPIDATRFNNKYDVLLSVSKPGATTKDLEAKAQQVAEELKKALPDAESVEVVTLFEEGVNPLTRQTQVQQTSFDWFGSEQDDAFVVNESIVIGLRTKEGQDVLAFDESLSKAIESVSSQEQFDGVNIVGAAGFASSIRQQVSSLQQNLLEGLLIVAAICLVFIGLRAGLLAAVGMLMTLSITAGILYLTGLTLNTITLFGLVLCLGLIVDDTVIMIEAIDAERKRKNSLKDSVIIATKKVALASASGTFTTVLGFAPLLFIGGILGNFIRVLPITIIVSLLTSLVVSLLFIPFMSRWFLGKDKTVRPSSRNPLEYVRKGIDGLGNLVSRIILGANTRRKKITRSAVAILISLVFIAGTGQLFAQLKFDIFPSTKDSNDIQVSYTFVPGLTIDQARDVTDEANQKITQTLGQNLESFTYLGSANNRQASANITLTSYEERDVTSQELVDQLQDNIGGIQGARIVVSQISAGPPKDEFPFKVQIPAEDSAQADQVANSLASFLNDKEITRPNGTTATVKEVDYVGEKVSITRTDGKRVVEVRASFDADDTTALVQAAKDAVTKEFFADANNLNGISKDEITFDFGNESENQESFQSVLIALPILVIAMYILLALQFKSFLQPLLILIAVPFSFFGVALALLLTNNPFSFFVMIAFFALIGISVNNSILLTDYANQGRRRGLSPRLAMANAVKDRIRPLVTTSTTSILALLPLALSDPFWESLAFTLIGGLAASTVLVVVSFPYYYLALEALRSRTKLKFSKRKRT